MFRDIDYEMSKAPTHVVTKVLWKDFCSAIKEGSLVSLMEDELYWQDEKGFTAHVLGVFTKPVGKQKVAIMNSIEKQFVDIMEEASGSIAGYTNTRWPIVDELSGFAAMLRNGELKLIAKPDFSKFATLAEYNLAVRIWEYGYV